MILLLSPSFLRRMDLIWKSNLQAFLIGNRNLFFFVPDSLSEVPEISPLQIDSFLQQNRAATGWELLGFLSSGDLPMIPGYVLLNTAGSPDPKKWLAQIYLRGPTEPERRMLEIRTFDSKLDTSF